MPSSWCAVRPDRTPPELLPAAPDASARRRMPRSIRRSIASHRERPGSSRASTARGWGSITLDTTPPPVGVTRSSLHRGPGRADGERPVLRCGRLRMPRRRRQDRRQRDRVQHLGEARHGDQGAAGTSTIPAAIPHRAQVRTVEERRLRRALISARGVPRGTRSGGRRPTQHAILVQGLPIGTSMVRGRSPRRVWPHRRAGDARAIRDPANRRAALPKGPAGSHG